MKLVGKKEIKSIGKIKNALDSKPLLGCKKQEEILD